MCVLRGVPKGHQTFVAHASVANTLSTAMEESATPVFVLRRPTPPPYVAMEALRALSHYKALTEHRINGAVPYAVHRRRDGVDLDAGMCSDTLLINTAPGRIDVSSHGRSFFSLA